MKGTGTKLDTVETAPDNGEAKDVETPAIECLLSATFKAPNSSDFQLRIVNINPAQAFAIIGYLEHYARSLLIEGEIQQAAAAAAAEAAQHSGIIKVPAGAIPRDHLRKVD